MAFGSLQSCSNVSSGHTSCPGRPARSTETAVPSWSCPVLPAQLGTVGYCFQPHPSSSAVSSWSPPAPSLVPTSPSASPASVNNVPFMLKPSRNLPNPFILCRSLSPRPCLPPAHHFQVLHLPSPLSFSCRSRHLIAKPAQCTELGMIRKN